MPNGTEHPFPGAENPFSGIHSFLQALAAEGKAPGEQLREVRANLPKLDPWKAGWIAYLATREYRSLPLVSQQAIWQGFLEWYVIWKVARDDAFWEELHRLVGQ
jgi:hypothetical protein